MGVQRPGDPGERAADEECQQFCGTDIDPAAFGGDLIFPDRVPVQPDPGLV